MPSKKAATKKVVSKKGAVIAKVKATKLVKAQAPVRAAKPVITSTQVTRGRVVSAKSAKTASVLVERSKQHSVYKKAFVQTRKYLVHSEQELSAGDLVEITKIRPVSKNKHWLVTKILGKDIEAIVSDELKAEAQAAIAEVLPEEKEPTPADAMVEQEEAK